jgi:hypothetical protein
MIYKNDVRLVLEGCAFECLIANVPSPNTRLSLQWPAIELGEFGVNTIEKRGKCLFHVSWIDWKSLPSVALTQVVQQIRQYAQGVSSNQV